MSKVSIITINKNNATGLDKTIRSVINQTFKEVEFIIIDGASNDGSIDIIKQNEQNVTRWISQTDSGIYNAMNKGIALATGEYVYFLNSGDCFINDNSLQSFFKNIQDDNEDFLIGNVLINDKVLKIPNKLSLFYILNFGFSHQSFFIKRSVYQITGVYDEKYSIVADINHFILALVKFNMSYRYKDVLLTRIEPNGVSSHDLQRNFNQREKFLLTEFPVLLKDYQDLLSYNKRDIFKRVFFFIKRKLTRNN